MYVVIHDEEDVELNEERGQFELRLDMRRVVATLPTPRCCEEIVTIEHEMHHDVLVVVYDGEEFAEYGGFEGAEASATWN